MRIAFVYDALYPYVKGGAERRFHELGRRLRDRHDVHFVSWQWWDGPPRLRQAGVTLHGAGRPPAMYGHDGKRTVREAVAFSARLMPVLLRNRWDVIDCSATPYLPLYASWLASRLTGARLVATWHEFWGEDWQEYLAHRPLVAAVAMRLEAGGRGLGDRVVAVSDFTARRLSMTDDARLRVVGNGVDLRDIEAAAPVGGGAELVFVGRLIDGKRVDLLIQAVSLLGDRLPGLRCAIVGDGPMRGALERQATELGVSERIRFLGHVDGPDAFGHMKAAKVLVMPSLREGFGLTVAEAQAAGTVPLVVRSPGSAAADLVDDGVDGLVVDHSAPAVAEGIATLLADPGRLAAMSQAARRTGAERDWDLQARRMEEIYRDLAASTVGDVVDPVGA